MLHLGVLLLILTEVTQTSLADPIVGQLGASLGQPRKYPANTEITEFHVAGVLEGLTHESGRLKPEEAGAFHIYAQVAPEYHNRVALAVNGITFSIMQTGLGGKADYGSLTTGGVIYLQKGDYISLVALYDSHVLMSGDHTFFGAFRISE